MTISLTDFLSCFFSSPAFAITVVLTTGLILVNGWSHAPDTIAACISTRSMPPRAAVLMAAVFNFLGVFFMTLLNAAVAETVLHIVDFGGDMNKALTAVCAALVGVVLWAVAAWRFGIPTSESNALIAGISGAAVALQGGLAGIDGNEWTKVFYGLVLILFGFGLGWCVVKTIEAVCRGLNRRRTASFFQGAQIAGTASLAFMHGAQDGQKYTGLFLLAVFLANGQENLSAFRIPVWLLLYCAAVMALGTAIGGTRMIKTVGIDLIKLEKYQGFSADIAGTGCLLFASLFGLPVSTIHTKTTAMMGVCAARRYSCVHWGVFREVLLSWVLVFPGCGLTGFIITKLFLYLF